MSDAKHCTTFIYNRRQNHKVTREIKIVVISKNIAIIQTLKTNRVQSHIIQIIYQRRDSSKRKS